MDEAEKRRLKKLGKQQVQERSRVLQQRLGEANPAAVGSDAWIANYRTGVAREQELRRYAPNRMSESEAQRDFVLHPIPDPNMDVGAAGWYVQCATCRDLVHTQPSHPASCQCGAVVLWLSDESGRLEGHYLDSDLLQVVRLIGRGTEGAGKKKPWWKLW